MSSAPLVVGISWLTFILFIGLIIMMSYLVNGTVNGNPETA